MSTTIYWFRNDLRLEDNPALTAACNNANCILPIYIHDEQLNEQTQWGFQRVGAHRQLFLRASLDSLKEKLRSVASDLIEYSGGVRSVFEELRNIYGDIAIYCEHIEAPEEIHQVQQLKDAKFQIHQIWQSSMLDPQTLPFSLNEMPDVFTQFRQQVEKKKLRFAKPIEAPRKLPPLPNKLRMTDLHHRNIDAPSNALFIGGESAAKAHVEQYFSRKLVDTYKQTRNQLIGMDYSSKFSPWLSIGCISPRSIASKLTEYEQQHGANDGTYWLWFELLWRDYFRFLHFKYENQLYTSRGLSQQPAHRFDAVKFAKWIDGNTGEPFIDAGMRELKATGYLSNRMRQIVASYWIYDMEGDWQAGAAWFESQLIDYDVYSNQGNWLYIAGKGTDPRGGRPFNVFKQSRDHDPDGKYQSLWLQKN